MILLHCLTFFFSFFLAANNIETLASKVQEKLKANTPTEGNYFLKACVRYFLSNFYFSPNDSPSKTIKDVFYCIQKTLRSRNIQIFVFPSSSPFLPGSHYFKAWSKTNFKVYDINCLNENLITHFARYLEKEKRYDSETFSIGRVLNKEHFYGTVMQEIRTKM